jgi:hypothetical protein
MPMNWSDLRSFDGSQQKAFEELCCQLAAYEGAPPGSNFVRKGAPDSGLECYWRLPNGDERGWQAKFFTSRPESVQWQQIEESLKTAFIKHPRLTSFTLCLPVDRADPRIENQRWFMDEWNHRVASWQEWAHQREREVEFAYWGDHELWERLSRDEHRGRFFFWFNHEFLSNQWITNRLDEAIANVGPRYSPKLHVGLPVAELFDGLGRTATFQRHVEEIFGKVRKHGAKVRRPIADVDPAQFQTFDYLMESTSRLLAVFEQVEPQSIGSLQLDHLVSLTADTRDRVLDCLQTLANAADLRRAGTSNREVQSPSTLPAHLRPDDLGTERYYLQEFFTALNELEVFSRSNEARLADTPALLLLGDAGSGKTHLFCDVARSRIDQNLPTVLLLGNHFTNREPWSQMVELLGLPPIRTKEDLLGALEAAAQSRGRRALILIDALNEGEGKRMWRQHLAGMLTTISHYPWLAIAFSVRTGYEDLVVPYGAIENRLVQETHLGFADHEYLATRTFFDFYRIQSPTVPLLVSEFENPLFLKLFCTGLRNRGLTVVPAGLQGITAVFELFVDSVEEKLCRVDYLDYDPTSQVVASSVHLLAQRMSEAGQTWLPREQAKACVNDLLPAAGYERSLFWHLLSEGLLIEDRFWQGGANQDVVRFSYERFSDHRIAQYLLDRHLDPARPEESFLPDHRLGQLVKDESTQMLNRGLVDAFSVQLPERINRELINLVSAPAPAALRAAFVESLIWRNPAAITEETRQDVEEHILPNQDSYTQFLDALLTVATNPQHPYNARYLHELLLPRTLAERDASWSIYLHYQYKQHGAVDRLVDWAWSDADKRHVSDEAVELCAIALAWFLTTAHRFLRDRATKALVTLLTGRIGVLRAIMKTFAGVNDPYVLERLFAVAYGCAMRSTDATALGPLARDVYESVFKGGTPPPHLLLRDYARGVIEIAVHRGIFLDIDIAAIRPPYKSAWPESELPKVDELKKRIARGAHSSHSETAEHAIYRSVMTDIAGDFAAYVIKPYFSNWFARRRGVPREPSGEEALEAYVRSLTDRQRATCRRTLDSLTSILERREIYHSQRVAQFNAALADEELDAAFDVVVASLHRVLGRKKGKQFEEKVLPYLRQPHSSREASFDISLAQRWIFGRVFSLGWNRDYFGEFDWLVNWQSRGREGTKPERIGKKYQWIACHELLARLSDNFEFEGDRWSDDAQAYDGPWQLLARNIDPSCLVRKTEDEYQRYGEGVWWFPDSYDRSHYAQSSADWARRSDDLPAVEALLEVANPDDNSSWLVLEAHHQWDSPPPPGEEPFGTSRKHMWYIITSFIVRREDAEALYEWAKNADFMGRWMPQEPDRYGVFLGEFFWAPAYESQSPSDSDPWTQDLDRRLPKKVLPTTCRYSESNSGYDCSLDGPVRCYLPTKPLVAGMGLSWNGVAGRFFDKQNNLVAFDPSVTQPGPGVLLVHKQRFLQFLDTQGYALLWTVLGEKQILTGMPPAYWLSLNGAYHLQDGEIEGITTCQVHEQPSAADV